MIATGNRWELTVLRVILGILFFAHGLRKTFGLLGGVGFAATMAGFTQRQHIPVVFAFLAIMSEFLGGLGLMVGALTRLAAFGVLCDMVVAIVLVNWKFGLFVNWDGKQAGEGIEFHLLAIAIAVVLMVYGAGAWSFDSALGRRGIARRA